MAAGVHTSVPGGEKRACAPVCTRWGEEYSICPHVYACIYVWPHTCVCCRGVCVCRYMHMCVCMRCGGWGTDCSWCDKDAEAWLGLEWGHIHPAQDSNSIFVVWFKLVGTGRHAIYMLFQHVRKQINKDQLQCWLQRKAVTRDLILPLSLPAMTLD